MPFAYQKMMDERVKSRYVRGVGTIGFGGGGRTAKTGALIITSIYSNIIYYSLD